MAKLSLLDRVVAAIDPVAAVRRQQARQVLAVYGEAYHGADHRRRAIRNWRPAASSPDAATLPQLVDLRAHSRDLVRNNPLAGGAVATVTTSVVGTGLSVQPQLLAARLRMTPEQAREWGQQAKEYFELWASRAEWCDMAARLNFYGLQELAFRSALESGDCFGLLPMQRLMGEPFLTKVQLVEADRVMNPRSGVTSIADSEEWAGGIRVDGNGRAVSAWIADRHPGDVTAGALGGREVPFFAANTGRRGLMHLCAFNRPGERRGVPYLAPVMEPLKQLGTYTDAEIMAAVVSGMFTVFVQRPVPEDPRQRAAEQDGTVGPGQVKNAEIGLDSGAIIELGEGEQINTANPGRPNTAFDPFVQAILRQIGVRLELPFEVLIKHYTASYSAARAALLEAWRFYRKRREWLAGQFCQPVYEAVITELVLDGRLRAPGFLRDPLLRACYLRAVWIGDAPGAIDPMKEAEAAGKRIEIGISDKAAETVAYSGRNWEDVHAQRVREQEAERRDGLAAAPAQPAAAGAGAAPADDGEPSTTNEDTDATP